MAILKVTDFTLTNEYYRIPTFANSTDELRLTGVISLAENLFVDFYNYTFQTPYNQTAIEALKYYTFYVWLRTELTRKTAVGASASPRFSAANTVVDTERMYTAYNFSVDLMATIGYIRDKVYPYFNY